MSSQNGGGPQVPFGDGNHVPIEDHRSDIGTVFKNIFNSCDTDNTGLVSASDLIIYVTPFLQGNESEFTELKMLLDPNGTNPPLDSEAFEDIMNRWTAQVTNDNTVKQISSNIAIRETAEVHVSSSSHTNNVGDSLCRINENEVLTLSNIQSYSGNALDNSDTVDVQALHDQMKQLQYENRKVTGELRSLKDQLLASEEQSELLHLDYEKLKKKLKAKERQLKDELQKNEKSSAEILETSTSAKKQVMKLEKIVASYEKEVSELKKNISDLEGKKKKLEDNNKGVNANEIELKKVIFRLESEVNLKDQEVAALEEQTANLHVQLEEHQESINHFMEINDCLKLEKSKIEKRFREHVSETIESRNSSINDTSLNSPIQGILRKLTLCNPAIENCHCVTPPQAQINPSSMSRKLSLNINDVQKLLYIETKKSVDSDEGSVAFSNKLLKNSKFDEVFSTPIKRGLLLDASLPQNARNVPPLSPLIIDNETPNTPDSPPQPNKNFHIFSTSHSCANAGKDGSNSLPTLFIIERSDPANRTSVNNCQSNIQMADSGSSESDMFWKLQLLNQSKTNSDQSLQSELLKAEDKFEEEPPNVSCYSVSKKDFELLESRIMEYERTIKELLLEVDRLKVSQRSSSDLMVNHKKSRRGSLDSCLKLEHSCVTLKNRIETLESDSNCKYIKIVDLMEEIEKLKQSIDQLKYVNNELEFERETLQEKLKTFHSIQDDSERILTQLDAAKEAHEELQKNFENTLKSERKISAEFVNVCCMNDDLNTKLQEVNQVVDQLERKNAEMTSEILKLKEENSKLEYKIASTAEEQINLISTRNDLNLRLDRMSHENDNLKDNLSKTEKDYQNVMSKYQEVTKTINQYLEQIQFLKLKTAESANCIGDLQTEIENLKATNQNLVQDVTTKKSQTELLKQMIEYQNTDLEKLKTEKDGISEKMYAFEKENEKILKLNKELSAEFQNSEKEKLLGKVKSLEELNQGSHLEIQSLLDEVKNVKDINSNILTQLDSLLAEKDDLMRNSEKLDYSIQTLKEDKRLLEDKLTKTEQQHRSTLKDHKMELKVKDDLNSKLVIEIEDKINMITILSKKKPCKICSSLKQAIQDHELKISDLEKENKTFKAEERHQRVASYDRLQIKISRLEEKLNDKEECLKQREGEIRDLELKNIEVQDKFDELESKKAELSDENYSLRDQLAQKSTLENKFRKNLEEIQKLQNDIQVLNQLKANVANELATFKNKSKSMLEKKDTRLHASTIEIAELKKEVARLQKKNIDLDKSLEKTRTASLIEIEKEKKATSKTKLLKDNLDSTKKENIQLKLDLEELNNRYGNLDKKNNDSLERIGGENSILKQQINECFGIIADLEKKHEKAQHDLQKSEVKNLSIRKVLTDVQSNVCEGVEDVMVKSMEIKNFEEMVKEKNGQVTFLQGELKVCQEELVKVKANLLEVNMSFGDLSDYLQVIKEGIQERRHRLARSTLTVLNAWRLKLESIPENRTLLQAFDKGESLNLTETFTGVLDEEMHRLKSQIQVTCLCLDLIGSLKSGYHNVETQASPPVHLKTIRKNTPNENSKGTETAEYFYSEKSLQTLHSISPVRSQGCMTSCDQSPDTGGLYIIDQSGDTSEEFATKLILNTNEEKCKAIALLKIASPNFSEIIEQIELVKDDSTAWTPLELEEKFTILHAAFSSDCGTVEERYQNQQSVRCRVEEKFTMETEKLVTTLISIQKLGREQELETLVEKCLRQVEHVVCTFSQASMSAMQYGALYHEQKIILGINFMILHSVYLQDPAGHLVHQLKFINTPNTEGSENLVKALPCANILEVEQSKEITSNAECDSGEGKYDNFGTKINSNASNSWWWVFACLLVILFVSFYAITKNPVMDLNSYGYPWSWLSWSDFRPVFQLNYLNGPPPI